MASLAARKATIKAAADYVNSGKGGPWCRPAVNPPAISKDPSGDSGNRQMTIDDFPEVYEPVLDNTIMTRLPSYPAAMWLRDIAWLMNDKADLSQPFFYLGGPMTGIPQFNFPRFHEVADKLRARGYNIVSPAELDNPEAEAAALASPDGRDAKTAGKGWADYLARDVVIVASPLCRGGIFIEGWEESSGAQLETFILSRLKKPLYFYEDNHGDPGLTMMDRDAALEMSTAMLAKRHELACRIQHGRTPNTDAPSLSRAARGL